MTTPPEESRNHRGTTPETRKTGLGKYLNALGRLASSADRRGPRWARYAQRGAVAAVGLGLTLGPINAMMHDVSTENQEGAKHPDRYTTITGARITAWETSDEKGQETRFAGTITVKIARDRTTLDQLVSEYYGKTTKAQLKVIKKAIATSNNLGSQDTLDQDQNLKLYLPDPEVVQDAQGKTLDEIASSSGFDETALKTMNAGTATLSTNGRVEQGSILLPREAVTQNTYRYYIVKSGDTYYGISNKYDIDVDDLVDANNVDARKLQAGQLIIVPSTSASETQTPRSETNESHDSDMQHIYEQYGVYAQGVEDIYGVPREVTLAQLIRETGWDGKSELSTHANNFFGIKAKGDWTGDVYTKKTTEEIAGDDISEYPGAEVIKTLPNDRVIIRLEQDFRKYPTPEEGFNDYGLKLNQAPYKDALGQGTSQEVAKKIAARWATDSAYGESLVKIIDRIQQFEATGGATATPKESAPAPQESEVTQRIQNIEVSKAGYEQFVRNMLDTSMEKYSHNPIMRGSFEGNNVPQRATTGLVLHRWGSIMSGTEFPTPAYVQGVELSDDQLVAARAIDILAGRGLGINFLMTRDGKVFHFTDSKVAHAAGHFTEGPYKDQPLNGHLVGVEVESSTEGDLTDAQLQSYIYLSYNFLESNGLLKKGEAIDLRDKVVGHGELSEYRLDPSKNHSGMIATSPRGDITGETARAFRARLAELLEENGFQVIS